MNSRPKILVVEDDELVRDVVVFELTDAGFAVIEAETGDAALEILEGDHEVDVLFTDIRMPGALDGWDLAERARELRPEIPVVYASGFSPKPARGVPGSVFLSKPYNADVIVGTLRRATRRAGGD